MSDIKYGADHVRQYQESGGEEGYIWRRGSEILLLTTKGRKSGEKRTMPLIFREIDGDYVIVASKGGHPAHPAWFVNMRDAPDEIEIQVKDEVFPVSFRVAEGEERERLWTLMNEVWPDYEQYQAKTDRRIPVVVLSRGRR